MEAGNFHISRSIMPVLLEEHELYSQPLSLADEADVHDSLCSQWFSEEQVREAGPVSCSESLSGGCCPSHC